MPHLGTDVVHPHVVAVQVAVLSRVEAHALASRLLELGDRTHHLGDGGVHAHRLHAAAALHARLRGTCMVGGGSGGWWVVGWAAVGGVLDGWRRAWMVHGRQIAHAAGAGRPPSRWLRWLLLTRVSCWTSNDGRL